MRRYASEWAVGMKLRKHHRSERRQCSSTRRQQRHSGPRRMRVARSAGSWTMARANRDDRELPPKRSAPTKSRAGVLIRGNGEVRHGMPDPFRALHGDHVDEHRVANNKTNPSSCTPSHRCIEHAAGHTHGADCGHERVPHGDHVDYAVGSHLHHPHDGHCDDHGPLRFSV
jgi:hypothetical protein